MESLYLISLISLVLFYFMLELVRDVDFLFNLTSVMYAYVINIINPHQQYSGFCRKKVYDKKAKRFVFTAYYQYNDER